MKRVFPLFFVPSVMAALVWGMLALPGCIDSKPTPTPKPDPKPAGLSIVVLHADNDASDTAPYADPVLDQYAETKGHALRVHPVSVVDESGKTPKYLAPYVEAAKGKALPVVFLGAGGSIKGTLEKPADVQAVIAYLEKTLGETVPEDGFYAGGQWRKLSRPSLMSIKPGAESRWTVEGTEAAEPIIPESQWVDVDLKSYVWKVKDQNGYSSCCPTSGCSLIEITGARSGLKRFTLSVNDAYARINGGSDNGSTLEDFTAIVTQNGVCTVDYAREQGVRKPSYKEGYQTSRAKHRVLKATYCPSFEAIASAIQRKKAVHFGLLVDSRFSPDSKGMIYEKRGRAGGGHAVLAVGMKKIGTAWYLLMLNSWGEQWGGSADGSVPKGCCLLHPSYVEFMFGAFSYSGIVSPSDDPIN